MPKKRVENSLTCVLSLDLFIRTVRKPLKSGLEKGRERERWGERERERERERKKKKKSKAQSLTKKLRSQVPRVRNNAREKLNMR